LVVTEGTTAQMALETVRKAIEWRIADLLWFYRLDQQVAI
jgi:hypothetical protein